ncbi:PREDICTED: GPI transamidase component PIG-S [Lupinus angustifolius]|uniref:GPI transamidase component PIG-S n=1 Tax=Lupinus angustifolius TaxID=3871 RepID=UPI00092E9483|nr:PREDICTED: GPI transamidase component PIG-S [Lupinus angustifolius]
MAEEISDSPSTSHPNPENSDSSSELDPNTMRNTKPGVKRFFLTLSVLFSFILGFPLLWKSIEIYRTPLPFPQIESFSSEIESNPLQFPCQFQAIFTGFDSRVSHGEVGTAITRKMYELNPNVSQCGHCSSYDVTVVVDSSFDCVGNGNLRGSDEDADELVKNCLGNGIGGGKVYSVVVVNGEEEDVRTVVGKYRHAWIVGKVSEEEAVWRVAEIFAKVFVNGGNEGSSIRGEFMPVGADGRIVLSFSLLNANPQDWIYDWNFQEIDETLLQPVVEALQPIANITVESQVLYHTPKSSFSYWDDEHGSHIFSTKDLPFFVNSNEWHLDTSVAAGGRSKVLQLVVYIPSAKECPLQMELPNGDLSKTNGFISPMWGGVVVWNPHSCKKDLESKDPVRHVISPQDLQKLFEILMGQLRQLLGLKSDNLYVGQSGTTILLGSERGFTEWELDVLSRKHICFNLLSCATTLGSLSRLVQSLPRMIIKDEIGKQVKFSLEAAKFAQSNVSIGMYGASAVSSRHSRSLAEDAFFHPSIMSISYYSFEHCFAIYSPFFLPVSMHVILAALREWKRYKQENKKYLAWKAKAQVTS